MANRGDTEEIFSKLSEKLTLKKDGPYGVNEPGRLSYLKKQIDVVEDGLYISLISRYIPKLAELLEITDRRGKSVPHHTAFTVFNAEVIPIEEYLEPNDSKTFRSAGVLGNLSLHSANSSSSCELHGTANKDSPLCIEEAGKLFGSDPGHEDALSSS